MSGTRGMATLKLFRSTPKVTHKRRNPMEPLLVRVARDFTDAHDLSERLRDLYRV